jgi:hypothetical protein
MNLASEPGRYFRDIYADLVERIPELPTIDPTPNLRECIHTANFVRAEMLARQQNLSLDVITHLREMAILQYIIDYRNFDGLKRLIVEFELTPAEVRRILGLIEREKTYPCFSLSKNTEMAVRENWSEVWQRDYAQHIPELMRKLSVLSRFITWLKNLFGRNRTL